MPSYRTHLSILDETADACPSAPVFRIPDIDVKTHQIRQWRSVSYAQFRADVVLTAKYWTGKLTSQDICPGSVIGLWLGGMTYVDALHIYGIARAGYIPQLISLRLPNPDVIMELLQLSQGKALIHDPSFQSIPTSGCFSVYPAVDPRHSDYEDVPLPPIIGRSGGDDVVMIFHTSGSTSGRPKLVPCTHAWWDSTIAKAQYIMRPKPRTEPRQDVTVWMGSLCHMAQSFMLAGTIQHGSCMVQYTKQAFSSEELMGMIDQCGLTRMNIFPTYLSTHLANSRRNPRLLAGLQGLDEIFISGLSMPNEDQQWVQANHIKVLDSYASTEVAVMMVSTSDSFGSSRLPPLSVIDGVSYALVPNAPSVPESEDGYHNLHAQLLELVVKADSPDCPYPSLRHADGDYHTGDLFLEVSPGRYIFSGRDDDWIKTENSLRCNTKAIEDNVFATCADLVSNCVVVGNGRPSPALFVEPAVEIDEAKLKRDIIRRIRPFHSRRYMHERVTSSALVFVVSKGILPRTATKGNIRRRAVEQNFKSDLDRAYQAIAA